MSKTVDCAEKGRLCNQIIRNLSLSLLAKKYDLYVEYSNFDNINNKLGIELFIGNQKYHETINITNNNYMHYFNNDIKNNKNFNFMNDFFQNEEITTILYNHLKDNKDIIINKNDYRERYNNNNDIFIHVRLTDVSRFNPGIDYYIHSLNLLKYDNIYLGTDNFNDDLIKKLKDLYPNIIFFKEDPIKTIQFGSTCKNIILSHGTFSAIIGYLGFFSNIYYPNVEPGWHPLDIFLNKGFNPVNFNSKYFYKKCMIEKQIFQSWHTKNVDPIIVQKTKRFLDLNPNYKYTLFTDEEMDTYVNDNFPGEIADCYNRIQIIVAKVDFWRYLILYKEGGIYLDMDSNIDKSLDLLINEDDDAIITAEGNPGLYVQWALMFAKNHPILKRTIELVVDNIKNNRYPHNVHQMTGPTVYSQAINEIHNKLFGEIIDHSKITNETDIVFKKDEVSYRLFAKDYGEFATFKDMTTVRFLTTKNMHWRHAQQRMTVLK